MPLPARAATLLALLAPLCLFRQDPAAPSAPSDPAAAEPAGYACPPCGSACDRTVLPAPGSCGSCGMELVPRESVLDVVVLLFENADLLSFAGPVAVFDASDSVLVSIVADTRDPIPCQGGISILPGVELESAPEPDVLIVPSGWGARDVLGDELVLGWVRRAVAAADHVLAIGTGTAILAATGALEGRRATGPTWLADTLRDVAPGAGFDPAQATVEDGQLWSARDPVAGIELAFALLERVAGAEAAASAAERLGTPRAAGETR